MKIHWNWGTKLVLAIIAFVAFMLVLVYKTTQQTYDLVEKDYYPKALEHQANINKRQNALKLTEKIRVENKGDHLRFVYQSFFVPDSISGVIQFYRPAGEASDFQIQIKPDSSNVQELSTEGLEKGKYIIRFDYLVSGTSYYQEETVIVNIY